MGKSHAISLLATVSHGCKEKKKTFATVTDGCQEANYMGFSHYIYENELTSENKCLPMNLAKKSQFYFSLLKVDSQNPKFSLEYLKSKNSILYTPYLEPFAMLVSKLFIISHKKGFYRVGIYGIMTTYQQILIILDHLKLYA